jgi:hypothetical protein
MKNNMATLETQYQQYLQQGPDPQLSYEGWMKSSFAPPYVSDGFQFGSQDTIKYDDSDISDWDVTLQDGLEDLDKE